MSCTCEARPSERLQLDYLRRVDVFAGVNFCEQRCIGRGVEIQNGQRGSAGLVSTERHRGDIDAVAAEQRADAADHAGTIGVFENKNNSARSRFDGTAVDADDARSRAEERTGDGNIFSFARRGEFEQIRVIAGRAQTRLVNF